MSELRDVLKRATDLSIDQAHVDNDALEVVHKATYDASTKMLHMRGSDPDNRGAAYTIDAPLEVVSGGDARGELIATSSALAASYTSGGDVGVTWSVESAVSQNFADLGSGELAQVLFDRNASGPRTLDADVDGFWFVPVRGTAELWNLKVFVPIGPGGVDRGAAGNNNRKSEFLLRFGDYDESTANDEFALLIEYSSRRDSRYNSFFLKHPGTGWATATGRTDLTVKVYEHNVVGPAGPAGGASPPFGEEELTARVQSKLDGAVSGVERTDGAGIKVSKNDGTSADVDVAPTRNQIASETGGILTDLDIHGNFTKYDSSGARTDDRLAFAETPVSFSGSFMTPVDATNVTQLIPQAGTVVSRRMGAFTGDDVSGVGGEGVSIPYMTKSVESGVGRITFGRSGNISVSWTEDILVVSRSGSGEVEIAFVLEHRRAGSIVAQWTVEHNLSDPVSNLTFPITRTIGLLPVEAGDWIEVRIDFSATHANSSVVYRLLQSYSGIDKALAINFFGSVAGSVASSTHTDSQIKQLADAEIVRAFGPHGLTWTRSPDAFGGVLKWAAANLDADTPAKRTAFRSALGLGDQEVRFLADGEDLNVLDETAILARMSKIALLHEPFPGPYLLYVLAGTRSDGTHDLRQWVWSLSQPGLSAHREALGRSDRPTGLTAAWKIGHSFADLPPTDSTASSVEVEALQDEPARWVENPIAVGMRETGGYLSGNVAAHGIGILATNSAAFASAPGVSASGLRALADNQGKLMVQIDDASTEGWSPPSTFYWRQAGADSRTEWESVPVSVLLDLQSSNIFVSNAVLTTRQYSELTGSVDVWMEYRSIEDSETVKLPGVRQAESVALSKLRVPTANGTINFPYGSPAQLRDGLQSLTGESRLDASAVKNIAASDTGAQIVAKLQALAGAARLSASAIRDLPAPTAETAAQIVAKLEALQGANRLSAAAVKGLRSLVLESTADSAAKASLLDILGTAYSGTNKLTDSGDIFDAGAIKTAALGDSQVTEGKLADAVSDRLLPSATSADDGRVATVNAAGDYHLVDLASTEGGDPVGTRIATSSAIPSTNQGSAGLIPGATWTLNTELESGIYALANQAVLRKAGPPESKSMIGFVAELEIGGVLQDRGFIPFGPGPSSSDRGVIGSVSLYQIVPPGPTKAKRVFFQQSVWDDGRTALVLQRNTADGDFPANSVVKIYEWVDTGSAISDESVIDSRIATFAKAGTADNLRRRQLSNIMDGDGTPGRRGRHAGQREAGLPLPQEPRPT